jgi:hypothetical protein
MELIHNGKLDRRKIYKNLFNMTVEITGMNTQ